MRRVDCLCAAAALFFFNVRAGADDCLRPCGGDSKCEGRVLDCLLSAGETRPAIEHLKQQVAAFPDRTALSLLLARAYLADGNVSWALRTLRRAAGRDEHDCNLRGWIAWLQLGEGNLEATEHVLAESGCPAGPADEGRWRLLRAMLADARGETDIDVLLDDVSRAPAFYRGDEQHWLKLRAARRPGWIEPLQLRLETSLGYTSNAKAGAPADPDSRGSGSLLGRMDVFSRFVWPLDGFFRPALEAGLKGHGIGEQQEREFSYLELSARPGVILGAGATRVFLGYHADYLVLARETEAQRRFYEGHRGELDLEAGRFTVFAGFGRRFFAESGRTRWEADGGLGVALRPAARTSLLLAAAIRYYWARTAPYRLFGATLLSALRQDLGNGLYGRLGLSLGYDDYFESGGSLGLLAFGSEDRRRDLLSRASAEIWSPSFLGARAAVGYEASWRQSSLDESNSTQVYDYLEHRLMVKLRWEFEWNPWAPTLLEPAGGVPLAGGAGEGSAFSSERIQDLLRQDEAARRGSSCAQ